MAAAPDPVKVAELQIQQREAEIKAYEAETERLKVLGATITPDQIQALVAQTVAQALAVAPPTHTQTTETIVMVPQPEEPEEPEESEGPEESGEEQDDTPPNGGAPTSEDD